MNPAIKDDKTEERKDYTREWVIYGQINRKKKKKKNPSIEDDKIEEKKV